MPEGSKKSYAEYRYHVKAAALDCNPRLKPGVEVVVRTKSPYIQKINNSKELYVVNEVDVFGVFDTKSKQGLTFTPLGKRVLLERENRAEVREGGIIIPDTTDYVEQSWTGFIESISPEVNNATVAPGNRVLFRWSHELVELGAGGGSDGYYLIVPYNQILARLEEFATVDVDNPVLTEG